MITTKELREVYIEMASGSKMDDLRGWLEGHGIDYDDFNTFVDERAKMFSTLGTLSGDTLETQTGIALSLGIVFGVELAKRVLDER